MIDLLRSIFLAVLYLFGISFFALFIAMIWVTIVSICRETKDD